MVEHLTDDDIMNLNRGGHDPFKVYAAYAQAVKFNGTFATKCATKFQIGLDYFCTEHLDYFCFHFFG